MNQIKSKFIIVAVLSGALIIIAGLYFYYYSKSIMAPREVNENRTSVANSNSCDVTKIDFKNYPISIAKFGELDFQNGIYDEYIDDEARQAGKAEWRSTIDNDFVVRPSVSETVRILEISRNHLAGSGNWRISVGLICSDDQLETVLKEAHLYGGRITKIDDSQLALEVGVWTEKDPICCPSQKKNLIFLWDAKQKKFVITESKTSQDNIRGFNFQVYIATKDEYKDCFDFSPTPIRIDEIKYHDFDKDGKEEAIIRASSCYIGTAGPDIHEIYKMVDSRPLELTINDNNGIFKGKKIYESLVGNRNFTLGAKGDRLVQRFYDRSGRNQPLTLFYKWNGTEFVLEDVIYGKLMPTPEASTITYYSGEKPFVQINWNYQIADYFNIYRAVNPSYGPWTKIINQFPASAHTAIDYNIPSDPNVKTLYYRITSVDLGGNESVPSEISSVIVRK